MYIWYEVNSASEKLSTLWHLFIYINIRWVVEVLLPSIGIEIETLIHSDVFIMCILNTVSIQWNINKNLLWKNLKGWSHRH